MSTETIAAKNIQEGDFIVGLDAYVVDVEQTEATSPTGRYNVSLGECVVVTFHDSQGEENYLILVPEHRITVRPEDGSDPLERGDEDEEF